MRTAKTPRNYEHDLRTCQHCKEQTYVRKDGTIRLFKYGVRHYAHAKCGLEMHGAKFFQMIPEHEMRAFPALVARDAGLYETLDQLVNDSRNGIKTQQTPTSKRRAKMEATLGECSSCGRKCDVVEMATRDDDASFQVCDECLEHASSLL